MKRSDLDAWLADVGRSALSKPPTLRASYDLAHMVAHDGIKGCLVEAGVFQGAQLAAGWRGACDALDPRDVVAFDSFKGIPIAGPEDREQPGIGAKLPDANNQLTSSGVSVCSVEAFLANMLRWGVPVHDIDVQEGWFQDTMAHWPRRPIAWLRLDADLFASTMWALVQLYPWLEPGGVCIVDDYALAGCRAAVDHYLGAMSAPPRLEVIKGGGGPVWWRKVQQQEHER